MTRRKLSSAVRITAAKGIVLLLDLAGITLAGTGIAAQIAFCLYATNVITSRAQLKAAFWSAAIAFTISCCGLMGIEFLKKRIDSVARRQ